MKTYIYVDQQLHWNIRYVILPKVQNEVNHTEDHKDSMQMISISVQGLLRCGPTVLQIYLSKYKIRKVFRVTAPRLKNDCICRKKRKLREVVWQKTGPWELLRIKARPET